MISRHVFGRQERVWCLLKVAKRQQWFSITNNCLAVQNSMHLTLCLPHSVVVDLPNQSKNSLKIKVPKEKTKGRRKALIFCFCLFFWYHNIIKKFLKTNKVGNLLVCRVVFLFLFLGKLVAIRPIVGRAPKNRVVFQLGLKIAL